MIKVLLVDDHELFRAGLRGLLNELPSVRVVGEAADGAAGLRMLEELHPDVVLMDISMPLLNGLTATSRIHAIYPHAKVLMLSMHSAESFVRQALAGGAAGYVLKTARLTELELAITTVVQGRRYVSPEVAPAGTVDEVPALEKLTPRQREILQLLAEGHSVRDIAVRLGLSPKTVETHRSQLMQRLDIHDVPGLVRFAVRSGLVSSET